jgi:hypothetical protein
MQCLVLVKFLPDGSISPEEFFTRIKARWYWLEDIQNNNPEEKGLSKTVRIKTARSAMCIADYESIEQLAIDLSIMPGAGISEVEVLPVAETNTTSTVPLQAMRHNNL